MNKEDVQVMAFQLIGFAGDAYSYFFQAIAKAKEGKFEEAKLKVQDGKKALVNAHNTQTELLAAEADGKEMEYSIIMVHAQDHLNSAVMYERLCVEFLDLYREIYRLKGLTDHE